MDNPLNNCFNKQHSFIEITRNLVEHPVVYEVVKWCKICGAVRIDREYEHGTRYNAGWYMDIKKPEWINLIDK